MTLYGVRILCACGLENKLKVEGDTLRVVYRTCSAQRIIIGSARIMPHVIHSMYGAWDLLSGQNTFLYTTVKTHARNDVSPFELELVFESERTYANTKFKVILIEGFIIKIRKSAETPESNKANPFCMICMTVKYIWEYYHVSCQNISENIISNCRLFITSR